ncbi:MAG: STAS/SEC14 domain-containing protein [Actinomycetota bacterium]
MDTFTVTDEGNGIIRVDAESRLVRKPLAVAMCDEVDKAVVGYDEFKILMNMSAMSKGTPAAGFYVLRSMKKYPLRALALFGANGFMRGMATTVLGLARFSNFRIFEDEAVARQWLERPDSAPDVSTAGGGPATGGVRRLAVPAALLTLGGAVFRARRRRRRQRRARFG